MAKQLSKIGIVTGADILAGHVTQSIDAFTGIDDYDITVSGSVTVSGSLLLDGTTETSQSFILTYNTSSGQVYYTASSAIGGGGGGTTPTLQQVTDQGNITTQPITSSALRINNNTNISPDASGSGQLRLNGNAYTGYIAMDGTAMHLGHNSFSRNFVLQTNETDRITIGGSGDVTIKNALFLPDAVENFTAGSLSFKASQTGFRHASIARAGSSSGDISANDLIIRTDNGANNFIFKQSGGLTITGSANLFVRGPITGSTAQIGNLKVQSGFPGGNTMFSTTTGVGFTFNHDLVSQPSGKNLGNSTRKWNNLFQGTNSTDYLLDIANGISFTFIPSVVSYYLWDGSPTRDDSTSENKPPIYSINPGQEEPTSYRGYFGIIQPSGSNDNLSTNTANKFGLFVVGQGGRTILGRKDYNRTNDSIPVDKMFTIYDGQTSTRELFSIETGSGTTRISGSTIIGKSPQSLYTTAIISSTIAATTQSIFGLSTSSYDGAFFDYTVQSGSNARAGSIMSVWNGGDVSFTEKKTMDIGDTTDFNLVVHISQSQAQIASHATNAGYKIKTIIRSI